jgi:hypothetical protein
LALIETTSTTTPHLILRSYRASHRRAYSFRWVASVGLVGFAGVTRSLDNAALGLVVFAIGEGSVRVQLRPYLAGERTVKVTMTEDEYRTEGPDQATSRTWGTFPDVRRVGDFWVLRILSADAMALPVSVLDADQTGVFKDLLQRRGLLHG